MQQISKMDINCNTAIYRSYSEDLQLKTWYNYHEIILPKANKIAEETGMDINEVLKQINPDIEEEEWNMIPIDPINMKFNMKYFCKNLEISMNVSLEEKKFLDTLGILFCGKQYIGHVSYHEFRVKHKHTGESIMKHSGDIKPWLGWLRQRISVNYDAIKKIKNLPPYSNLSGEIRLFVVAAGWCEKGECPLNEFNKNSPVLELRINDEEKKRHIIAQSFNLNKTACANLVCKFNREEEQWQIMPTCMYLNGYSDDIGQIVEGITKFISSYA